MTCWALRITQGKIEVRPDLPALSHILADAVEAIRRFRPALALVDIGLPGFDGYQVAQEVRAGPGGARSCWSP